jgi:hypothetical protein
VAGILSFVMGHLVFCSWYTCLFSALLCLCGSYPPHRGTFSYFVTMNSRAWNILCWNVRGLNDKDKWGPIRNKIEESHANIFVFKKQKKNLLIGVLSASSLRKDLISLTSAQL